MKKKKKKKKNLKRRNGEESTLFSNIFFFSTHSWDPANHTSNNKSYNYRFSYLSCWINTKGRSTVKVVPMNVFGKKKSIITTPHYYHRTTKSPYVHLYWKLSQYQSTSQSFSPPMLGLISIDKVQNAETSLLFSFFFFFKNVS